LPFTNIVIWGTNIGSTSDLDGNFTFTGIDPGYVRLAATSVGYEDYVSEDILVTNAKNVYIEIPMTEKTVQLDEVVVKASPFRKPMESPLSMRSLDISEIEKNPGGNRDISRVIQSLPGVASTVSFRNDVIVRGGGASENTFYLDGVEIPNLNHFSTQGASGGAVGIINVDFIREVDYYSGAFPASKGNTLSSVFEFKQIEPNKDKMNYKATVGATDLGLSLNGPLGEKSGLLFSVRRSYLSFLFDVIGLPFLPTYNDLQFKYKIKFDKKNELSIIGLGALDQFELNTGIDNPDESQRYILGYLPVNEQWSYTIGAVYKHYRDNGFDTWVLSRNYLNNRAYKYFDNVEVDSLKLFDYTSSEAENRIRYEKNIFANNYKINVGAGGNYARYTNDTYQQVYTNESQVINYNSKLDVFSWNVFGQVSKKVLRELDQAEYELMVFRNGQVGELRITTCCYTCYHWLPGVMKSFSKEFPGVEIKVLTEYTCNNVSPILEGKVDAILTSDLEENAAIQYTELFRDEQVAVVAKGHPWQNKAFVREEDFADQNVIIYSKPLETVTLFRQLLIPKKDH